MRRSDFRRALAEIVADASGIDVDLDVVLAALDAACGIGYPTSTLGSGDVVVASGSLTSVVERQAFARDQAMADRQRLTELVQRAHRAMAEAAVIRRQYAAPPRVGRATRKGHADDGCEVMATADPPTYEVGRLTDVGGILPRKRRLGRWAHDFVAREGRLPLPEEVNRHARGRPVLRRS